MMKLVKLSDLFHVRYGVNLELNRLTTLDRKGIPFVSQKSENNGVVAYVQLIAHVKPNPANTLSVSTGGSVCEAFLQKKPYYSGRDLFFLTPKINLSDDQMIFYCICITANKYRYSYGRQANKTLKNLKLPSLDEMRRRIPQCKLKQPVIQALHHQKIALKERLWRYFILENLITKLERGKEIIYELLSGKIPLVSSSSANNGVTAEVSHGKKLFPPGLTVANDGSVGNSFYQNTAFMPRLLLPP